MYLEPASVVNTQLKSHALLCAEEVLMLSTQRQRKSLAGREETAGDLQTGKQRKGEQCQ